MKNTHKNIYLLLLAFLPFIYSCEDENAELVNEVADPLYTNGVLIVNQGNFSQGNGSLDFYSYEQEETISNVYEKVNEEAPGGIIQHVFLNDGKMFIITNNTDKVIAVEPESLKMLGEVQGLTNPRYISVHGNKAYVSVWGPYEEDYSLRNSEIAVIDLNNLTVLKKIPVASGPEGITTIGNKVFVANSFSNVITVINPEADTVLQEIETATGPNHFQQDADGKLWVSYSSGYLIRFNPETYEEEARLELEAAPTGPLAFHENKLYYRSTEYLEGGGTRDKIYMLPLDVTEGSPELVLEGENIYTFNIDPLNGQILTGIAQGADPGTIVRYDKDGNEVGNFAAGVFPHELIFR